MNEVLSKLAETLDISNKGLEKLIESVGGVNYAEVYQVLVREYAIYSAISSLSVMFGFIFITSLIGSGILITANILEDFEVPKMGRFVFGVCLVSGCLLAILSFTPIFYPNVNLMLEIIKD